MSSPCLPIGRFIKNQTVTVQFTYIALYAPSELKWWNWIILLYHYYIRSFYFCRFEKSKDVKTSPFLKLLLNPHNGGFLIAFKVLLKQN